jgi:hypothetical protein
MYEWTSGKDKILEEMWRAGYNARQISEKIGCNRQAVYNRVRIITERKHEDEMSRDNSRDSCGIEHAVNLGGGND